MEYVALSTGPNAADASAFRRTNFVYLLLAAAYAVIRKEARQCYLTNKDDLLLDQQSDVIIVFWA